jgi:hypothetical protein
VISDICDRPGEFLLYLRRRTDSGVATFYRATDELDLFMLFLEGDLYVDDHPDEVRRAHPSAPPAKVRDRRRHEKSAVATVVADHCQPLNEWYSREQIPESEPRPSKPSFNIAEPTVPIIDAIATRESPGWLRCTTDLLGLSGETQAKLVKGIKECRRRATADGTYHESIMSFAGMWGHPTVFVAVAPTVAGVPTSAARLSQYMRVKSYQLQSDRAYGLLVDTAGILVDFIYQTKPPRSDPELDRLVSEMGLQPVGESSRSVPPSARRTARRSPKRKKRRKERRPGKGRKRR